MENKLEFPRDINNYIVSKLDIDTRRLLGIYTKLEIPEQLSIEISGCFNRIKYGKYNAVVRLGPKRMVFPNDDENIDFIYSLSRGFIFCDGFILVWYQVVHISSELNIRDDYFNEYSITSYDDIFDDDESI